MVTGHLREQNGYFQMILTWKDASGKRRSKSISTGLTVKGNKKRVEKMLMKARSEFNPDNVAVNKEMLFTDFLGKWLNDKVTDIPAEEYSKHGLDTVQSERQLIFIPTWMRITSCPLPMRFSLFCKKIILRAINCSEN